MKKDLFIIAAKISSLFKILKENNVDLESFLEQTSVNKAVLVDPDYRVSIKQLDLLLNKAVEILNDDCLGLHMADMQLKFANIVGYVLMNCQNIKEMIYKYKKYQRIVESLVELTPLLDGGNIIIKYEILDEKFANNYQILDFFIAGTMKYTVDLLGEQPENLEVRFSRKKPANYLEYERVFNCKVEFESSMTGLIFESKFLDKPFLQPNRELLKIFEQYASDVLKKLNEKETYTNKVTRLILKIIGAEAPTIEFVAKRLAISVRNLQAKLKEEGTTYSEILKNVRKDMAIKYLVDKNVSITEISYLLGFSEPSVFNRTFKVWTGYSPGAYRANNTSTL